MRTEIIFLVVFLLLLALAISYAGEIKSYIRRDRMYDHTGVKKTEVPTPPKKVVYAEPTEEELIDVTDEYHAIIDYLRDNTDDLNFLSMEMSESTIIIFVPYREGFQYQRLQLHLAELTERKLYLLVQDPNNKERAIECYE